MEGAGGETVKWESQVGLVLKAGHYWKENGKWGIDTKTCRKMSSQEGKWRGRGESCGNGSECITLRMKIGNQEKV